MVSAVTDLLVPQLTSVWGIIFFIILVIIYGFGLYAILTFLRHNTREIREKNPQVKRVDAMIIISQVVLLALVFLILFTILIDSKYYTAYILTASLVSEPITVIISVLFAKTFFSWYRSNKSSIIVLLYGVSFAIAAFAIAEVTILDIAALIDKPPIIDSKSEVVFPSDVYEPGTAPRIASDTYRYAGIAAFIFVLAATALLLKSFSKKIGSVKYWILILLPLLYYFTTLLDNFGIYVPETDTEFLNWYLYSSLNSTAGGVLFGIAFWQVAKSIRQNHVVRTYMRIAAYGFILYFITNQVGLSAASYPPLGIAAFSLLGLSTYMVFLGVYSSAVSISQDIQLRKSIRKLAAGDKNLLSSIGTAYMDQEIQRTVKSMKGVVEQQEKELEEQTGIEANLEEDEMKNYLEQVMQEVGKSRKA